MPSRNCAQWVRWGAPASRSPVAVTADDDWARSVMDAMLAHRAEQRLSKVAVPTVANDEQIRACCRVDQDLGGVAVPDLRADLHVAARARHRADGFGHGLVGRLLVLDCRQDALPAKGAELAERVRDSAGEDCEVG